MTTIGSTFSGCDGLALGLSRALGAEVRWHAEVDKDANKVLAHRWPGVPNLGSVGDVDWPRLLRDGIDYSEVPMAGPWTKMDAVKAAEAVKMYDAGLSCGDVAEFFGVSRQSMWDVLHRRTTMRKRERYGQENHFYRGTNAPDKVHNIMEKAVERGILVRPEHCSVCGYVGKKRNGAALIEGHHDDYNQPLNVRWLCQPCHHEWHRHNVAVPLREDGDATRGLADVDILVGGPP